MRVLTTGMALLKLALALGVIAAGVWLWFTIDQIVPRVIVELLWFAVGFGVIQLIDLIMVGPLIVLATRDAERAARRARDAGAQHVAGEER